MLRHGQSAASGHGQCAAFAVPRLGSGASGEAPEPPQGAPGGSGQLSTARPERGRATGVGVQPARRVLERAASKQKPPIPLRMTIQVQRPSLGHDPDRVRAADRADQSAQPQRQPRPNPNP
eukprot:scaffold128443_cov42-Phaeocystis_antarctica.AAC.2